MKFSCDRCQTRYSIGDEKVRGKILKIRCKTCGNIIQVREATQTAQATGAVAATAGTGSAGAYVAPAVSKPGSVPSTGPLPPMPGAQGRAGIDWFVAIKGKQHGPAKKEDIARLFREGKITDRTYLWHEAMPAWTRLKEVPEMQALLAEPTARRPPPPPPPSDDGAEIVNFAEARQQRLQQQGLPQSAATGIPHDPFAAVSGNPMVGDPGAPRDSTRVFIMQAGLANRGKKHRMYALAAAGVFGVLFVALFLDYREIIKIPGLHSVVNVVTQREVVKAPVVTTTWDSGEEDPAVVCKLLPDKDKCQKEVTVKNAVKRAQKKAGRELTKDELDAAFASVQPGGEANLRVAAGGGGDTFAGPSNQSEADRIKNVFATGGKGGPTQPKLQIEAAVVKDSDINPENVKSVIDKGKGGIQGCVESNAKTGNLPSGKQRLIISLNPNGRVDNVRFQDGSVSASPVGECIRNVARKWVFVPFVGDPADIDIPLILSVGM